MKEQEFQRFAAVCKMAGVRTLGDYSALIQDQKRIYNSQNVYINGELATKQALAEFELCLRLGIERATAKCYNGSIYYTTI